jgi:hypothetical protein
LTPSLGARHSRSIAAQDQRDLPALIDVYHAGEAAATSAEDGSTGDFNDSTGTFGGNSGDE